MLKGCNYNATVQNNQTGIITHMYLYPACVPVRSKHKMFIKWWSKTKPSLGKCMFAGSTVKFFQVLEICVERDVIWAI